MERQKYALKLIETYQSMLNSIDYLQQLTIENVFIC